MKDLDSIKLKSEENDFSKKEKSFYNFEINPFNNKEFTFQNFLKIGINQLYNISLLPLVIIINIYGLNSYLYSLIGCKNSRAYCLSYYSSKKINEIVFYVLKASISYSLIFILTIWRLLSFSYFLLITSMYYALYFHDHGDGFEKHGYYNMYGFILFFLIFSSILLYLTYIIKLILIKSYRTIGYILIPTLIIFLIFYIKYIFLVNCYGYHTGLNGMKIDDNKEKYSCFYDYPNNCYIDIFSPFMEIVKQLEV